MPAVRSGKQVGRGDPVGDPGVMDLVFRPHQALGHRLLRDQEGPRNLRGGQAGQRAQGERDPGLQAKRRMTGGYHQPPPILADAAGPPPLPTPLHGPAGIAGRRQHGCLPQFDRLGRAAAQPVQRPVARDRGQPGAGTARNAVARPSLQRLRERVLHALLGQVPAAGHADQRGDDPAPLLAERLGDGRGDVIRDGAGRHSVQNGLTSIVPNLDIGCLAATSIASSRSAHSITSKPAICSFVSANGPSATRTSPPRTRTVVASLTGRRRSPSTRTPRPPISSTQASVELTMSEVSSGLSSTDSSPQIITMYFIVPPRSGSPGTSSRRWPVATTTNEIVPDGQPPEDAGCCPVAILNMTWRERRRRGSP